MGNCKSKRQESSNSSRVSHPENKLNLDQENNAIESKHFTGVQSTSPDKSVKRKTNLDVIDSTKIEICNLLERIHEFYGTSENDKNYKFVDEMLTRVLIELDKLHCNNVAERICRKTVISGANQAITILERKLQINTEIKNLETNLTE